MASLTLAVGPVTATVSTTDSKAAAVLQNYAASIGATGTNQQKADAVVAALAQHIESEARAWRRQQLQMAAVEAGQEELEGIGWA